MDIVTQGIIGATFAQSFSKKDTVKIATLSGFLAGLAPDSDSFIRSSTDTLLSIEYHRHFTHSLLFIPLGALIASVIVWVIMRRKWEFKKIYFFSFLGYATHGLLDACTSYGTRLLLPFSTERIAWDNIGIIDLFFTLPLLIAMIFVLKTKKIHVVQTVFAYCMIYLFFGVVQRERVQSIANQVAISRGHTPTDIQAKPTIGQLFLWKSIYVADGNFYVDAVRLGIPPFFETKLYNGESAPILDPDTYFSDLDKNTTLYKDILRFKDFSSNMLILSPDHSNVIGDARYSLLPNQIKPLWGISYDLNNAEKHAVFTGFRVTRDRDLSTFLSMIAGTYPSDPLPQ